MDLPVCLVKAENNIKDPQYRGIRGMGVTGGRRTSGFIVDGTYDTDEPFLIGRGKDADPLPQGKVFRWIVRAMADGAGKLFNIHTLIDFIALA